MPQETQKREITISVKTDAGGQIKKLAQEIGGINQSVSSLSKTLSSARNIFQGFFAASFLGVGISQITGLADSMQLLGDRIKVLSGGTADVDAILKGLLDRANSTKTSVAELTDVYAKLAQATKNTKINSAQLLDLTEGLQNMLRLSGASAGSGAAALQQLSQALASGRFSGEEFNSVAEQAPEILNVLSKSLNKTQGELRAMGKAGKLTAEVVLKGLFEGMGDVNSRASQLGQTFGQTVTVAFNDFQSAVGKINKEFDLNGKFAKGVEFITERLGIIASVMGLLSLTAIPNLIAALGRLRVATVAFAASNPAILTLSLLGLAAVATIKDFDDLENKLESSGKATSSFFSRVSDDIDKVRTKIATFLGDDRTLGRIATAAGRAAEGQFAAEDSARQKRLKSFRDAETEYAKIENERKKEKDAFLKSLSTNAPEDKLAAMLSNLNKQYLAGTISAGDYYSKIASFDLEKTTRAFRDGKEDLEKYTLAMNKLSTERANKLFSEGSIGLAEFNKLIEENKLSDLDTKLQNGTISLQAYNNEVIKVSDNMGAGGILGVATQNYLDSLGTTSSALVKAFEKGFSALEDELVTFATTGEATFTKFADSIIADMIRIATQAYIIKPILAGLEGFISGSSTSVGAGRDYGGGGQVLTPNANGNIFSGGLKAFAQGGVVNAPTMFKYGSGKNGIMGEAGPEAILPLARGPDGKLGVAGGGGGVTVQIINNAGAEVSQKETTGAGGEKILQVTIEGIVDRGLSSGRFDRTMASSFGSRRKGL